MQHQDKTGKIWELSELETSHLINLIKMIERRSKEGVTVSGNDCNPENYYERTLFGEEALEELGYSEYKEELDRRLRSTVSPINK